jgi:hypothetical protein
MLAAVGSASLDRQPAHIADDGPFGVVVVRAI